MRCPLVTLGDCCEIVSGATPSTAVKEYWDGPICWATPKDLSALEGHFISDTPRKLTEVGLASCAATILQPNSVLFSSRAPIGHVAVNTVPMATNQGFKSFVPKPDQIDAKYLFHWLRANRSYLESLGVGATFKEVSKTIVSRVEIPLPSLPEQRRIAAILDNADVLRAQRRAAIAKLDELLQSVFIEMFGDPVMNPMGWPMVSFGEVTNSRLGKMLDKKTSQGDYMRPYLANMNVQWGRFELGNLRQMNFSLEDQEKFSLRSGDILMCEGGEPGRCAIWKAQLGDCYYQKALHRIRCDPDKSTPEYIQWLFWFLAKAGAFGSSIAVATIAHLPGIKLKKLEIPLPPVDRQQYFAQIAEKIESQKQTMQRAVDKAETLFASLQQNAFSGKL